MTGGLLDAQTAGQQVRDALRAVRDPQFGRPITDLGFVAAVDIDKGRVHLQLRAPSYFSPSTYGGLVSADARAAVSALRWVESVEVCLVDNVPSAQSSATPDADEVRRSAFLARQYTLLRDLLEGGLQRAELCALCLADLSPTADSAVYLQRRVELHLPLDADAPVVVTADGTPVLPDEIDDHLAWLANVALGG